MKTKFSTKVLALVLTLALVVPMFVFTTSAEGEKTITFKLGADGAASHADGTGATTYTETVEGYKLSITGGTNMYTGARDAKGNSCIKFGTSTSSKTGICSFTVPEDVTSVVLYVAKYKANATKITVNGTTYTLTKNSDDGQYDEITVDTTTNKTVNFATVSSSQRAMLNDIKFVVPGSEPSTDPTISINAGQNYIDVDGTLTLTAKTENVTEQVVWSSDNTDVATVENGVVTGKAMGTAKITAKANGVSSDTFVTVYPKGGTTISIAEALKVCELTGTTDSPYAYTVEGTVKSIDTEYSTQYNNITVTITDGTDSIVVFRMKGGSELEKGHKIGVSGYLVNYSSNTPEFATGAEYKIIAEGNAAAVLEELNEIAAYMSLAYKYNAVTETVDVPATITDTLNREFTGITKNSSTYATWTNTGNSGVVYAGQSAGGNDSIQLRTTNSNSGIVTTTSGGKATKITVVWNSNTASGRTLDIYGSNEAYTSPDELYGNNPKGERIGSIVYGTSTELDITKLDDDYAYIGIRSNGSAMYLDSVEITWNTGAGEGEAVKKEVTNYSDSEFVLKCGVDADLVDIENVESYGIKVSAGGNSVPYSTDAKSWTEDEENGIVYVVVSLGDIINDVAKLGTEFTVQAYVVVDGVTYVSEQTKTYSVATMVKEYEGLGYEVSDLYNYLRAKGLIEENA